MKKLFLVLVLVIGSGAQYGLSKEYGLDKVVPVYESDIIMARVCKVGSWLYRINPNNDRELQRRSTGSARYSFLWKAPNNESILDIMANEPDLLIYTDKHVYVRQKSGVTRVQK